MCGASTKGRLCKFSETFGSEHRPIVEFALDNVQTLKLRKSRFEAQVQGSHNDAAEDVQQNRDLQTSDAPTKQDLRKTERQRRH